MEPANDVIASERPSHELILDRRVNIVSLANLAALVALLFTALGTWYALVNRVDTLNLRVDTLTTELAHARADTLAVRVTSDSDVREMRSKGENISVRLSVVETEVKAVLATVNRMDQRMETTSQQGARPKP